MKLHLTISCFVSYCGCHIPFEIWIAIMERRDLQEVIAITGRIILKCIEVILEYVNCIYLVLYGDQ